MVEKDTLYDAIVIGGGFYGIMIAVYLKQQRGFKRILVIEKESALMARASRNNQARVHTGYHYPRSFITAYRSKINAPQFIGNFSKVVSSTFTSLYAIAKSGSKVNSQQFERMMSDIGAPIETASNDLQSLFSDRLISKVYLTEESVFSATSLLKHIYDTAVSVGIKFLLDTRVVDLACLEKRTSVLCEGKYSGLVVSKFVFNCTYAGLNQITKRAPSVNSKLRHEITEMALIEVPTVLKNTSITVMDGPFFSLMPYPDRDLFTLSHVRYTPHFSWSDKHNDLPLDRMKSYHKNTRYTWMIRDAARYVPLLNQAIYRDSIFEVKTIMEKSEVDDGRPILFEKNESIKGLYSILGGKIDNIYDILEKLDLENFNV